MRKNNLYNKDLRLQNKNSYLGQIYKDLFLILMPRFYMSVVVIAEGWGEAGLVGAVAADFAGRNSIVGCCLHWLLHLFCLVVLFSLLLLEKLHHC